MTSIPASRSAAATTLAPRSWPSRPGLATRTRIGRCIAVGTECAPASARVPAAEPARPDRVAKALKWVGAATAVLSLVFALRELVGLVSGHVERGRRVSERL